MIIVSSPSGGGKTTIVERLLKRHPDWVRSISATTRLPRTGEKHGVDYLFFSPEAFQELEKKGALLESAKVFDQLYGTPKGFVLERLKEGKNVILAIDVQGAQIVRGKTGKDIPFVSIFILPPSLKVLRERLENRKTDKPEEIERRLQIAQEEIKAAGDYDFTVINQTLEETVLEMESCIEKFRKERRKKENAIRSN
ncbi:MAG: guanylate kinase [Candidatus Omnitrophica bacterium]|nr:guanylate kinase [Candidatus Omnitrophota bacterium]